MGGTSRIPAVREKLSNFFKANVTQTLNAAESIARGAALMCAMKSPAFKVREFKVSLLLLRCGPLLPLNVSVGRGSGSEVKKERMLKQLPWHDLFLFKSTKFSSSHSVGTQFGSCSLSPSS